jgi:crotonobetainyl-CoA:carnitine CoA-transferase CaiB-like acyl-CoA transferase
MDLTNAFEGITVCDLSQGIAGPHATMLLAQYGANVIKVEPPGGDWSRTLGEAIGGGIDDHTPSSYVFNQGKRSVVLDLKSADGRNALMQLLERADLLVESFRPGVAARLGLSYDEVRRQAPSIVYASLSGYGQTGPYAERGAVDALMQGFSGLMVMNRTPEGRPHRMNMTAIDVLAGLYLHAALAAAIARRRSTGEGGYIDVSLMQSAAAFQAVKIMEFHVSGGAAKPLYMPAGYLRTADGAVSISTMRQEHYVNLCGALGRGDLVTDVRFAEIGTRIENGVALMAELERETSQRATDDLIERLVGAGVFVERVLDYGGWLENPHVKAVRAYDWKPLGAGTAVPVVRVPGLPEPAARLRAPVLGEHTEEILAELSRSGAAGTGNR